MAKIELKGTIRYIGEMEEIGEKKTKKKSFLFDVKGYTDEFGEQKGRDQSWRIDVIGSDRITKFLNTVNAVNPLLENTKGTAIVYVESTEVASKDTSKPNMFIVNNNLGEFLPFVSKLK